MAIFTGSLEMSLVVWLAHGLGDRASQSPTDRGRVGEERERCKKRLVQRPIVGQLAHLPTQRWPAVFFGIGVAAPSCAVTPGQREATRQRVLFER